MFVLFVIDFAVCVLCLYSHVDITVSVLVIEFSVDSLYTSLESFTILTGYLSPLSLTYGIYIFLWLSLVDLSLCLRGTKWRFEA